MKYAFSALAILLAFTLSSCISARPKPKKSEREQAFLHQDIGVGYLKGKNYPAALKQLIIANKLAPNEPSILNSLGIAMYYRGRLDLAEKYLRQSLKINPKFTEARGNLGHLLIEKKKYSQALTNLSLAREDLTYGSPEKIHANLGRAYFYLSDYSMAEKELNLALKTNREYCIALFYKIKNLFYQKKYGKAYRLADRTELTCAAGDTEELLYYSGMSFFLAGKPEQAKNRFKKLIRKYPENEFAEKAQLAIATMEESK